MAKIMKKSLLTILIAIITSIAVKAQIQTPINIYTPNGSLVGNTYLRGEMLMPRDMQWLRDSILTVYPQLVIIDSASSTYNCHGYAWFMTEDGDHPLWMGYPSNPTEIYWLDGSYIETYTPAEASKVSYADDDHSAITTETPDFFISKWGDLPLVMHHKYYGPYDHSRLRYFYRATKFEGPEFICPNATYTLSNNAQATFWSVTPDSVFTITSSTATSVTITASNTAGQSGTLAAVVGGVVATTTIKSCQVNISGNANPYNFQQVTYSIPNLPLGTLVTWNGTNNINIISGQGTGQVTISICSDETAILTATLSGTISGVLTKSIYVINEYITTKNYNDHIEATFVHPYALCYDWVVSSNFVNSGTFNCNNQSTLNLYPVFGATGGSIQVRGKSGACVTPWIYATVNIWEWQPQLTGYLNPMRGEPFYASLVEDVPNYTSYNNVEYHWYFDNNFFGTTYEPYIFSHDWPCGDSRLKIIVQADNNEAATEADFWGMCHKGSSGSEGWSAAYPNPADDELIIDKIEEDDIKPAKSKSTIKVLLYSHSTTKLVFSQDYSSSTKQIKIDTSKLPNGVYYLNILENGEKVKEQIIIINH